MSTNQKLETPEDCRTIMVTYRRTIYTDYGSSKRTEIVTKKGFYSKLFNNISVPPSWQYFNGVLLPHGFGGDRVKLDDVIEWKYCV